MAEKTEFEKDMENLRQLQKEGKINPEYYGGNLENIAKHLPEWRKDVDVMEFDDNEERLQAWRELEGSKHELAEYGRGSDLDKLMADDWGNRSAYVGKAIADRGRDKDLDQLVNSEEDVVRVAVVKQGRDKDLDKLVSDESREVRITVAQQGRDKDLDKLVSDKQ